MATYTGKIRQGLPRVAGGEPWPQGGEVSLPSVAVASATPSAPVTAATQADSVASEAVVDRAQAAPEAVAVAVEAGARQIRRGLPRVAGGDPWPAAGVAASAVVAAPSSAPESSTVKSDAPEVAATSAATDAKIEAAPAAVTQTSGEGVAIRRGLPRQAGGESWPAAGTAPAWASRAKPTQTVSEVAEEVPSAPLPEEAIAEIPAETTPLQKEETPAKAVPARAPKKKREPIIIREKTLGHWIRLGVFGIIGAILAAGILVLAARGVTTLPGVPEFLKKYPGEYHPVVDTEPGFPWWARWSHFLNIFLMVLIIRSGILVRTQQKPPAFWTPKKGGKKISINLWLHTSLDIIWLVNGIAFVVLLFVSGHWARIVPTSWEVFPNAASAMLQYMTLEWPTENGWVNYNSLQQLMYFIVIFIAAPLAAITGVRMSEWWPEKATRLNKIYPAPVARAIHFPTMLFFVLFILVHVFLVFSTGALRNLNHMFAGTDVVNWTGFWLFALAIAITAGGWFAARPLILAPIANLFGRVSNR